MRDAFDHINDRSGNVMHVRSIWKCMFLSRSNQKIQTVVRQFGQQHACQYGSSGFSKTTSGAVFTVNIQRQNNESVHAFPHKKGKSDFSLYTADTFQFHVNPSQPDTSGHQILVIARAKERQGCPIVTARYRCGQTV